MKLRTKLKHYNREIDEAFGLTRRANCVYYYKLIDGVLTYTAKPKIKGAVRVCNEVWKEKKNY